MILSCLRRSAESNDTKREVPRVETVINRCPSMSLLHTPLPVALPRYAGADKQFRVCFLENEFGCPCDVCDRLWFKNEIKKCQPKTFAALTEAFVAGIDFSKYSACRKYH